jgi:predicted enzyme related to lactoylglutathione lyase
MASKPKPKRPAKNRRSNEASTAKISVSRPDATKTGTAKTKTRAGAKATHEPAARTCVPSTQPMFNKVAFTLFSVSDPARARAFYEQILGLQRGLSSENGSWTEYDLPAGGCLALFYHPNPAFRSAPGGASIAFEVSDLDALNKRLRAAGVEYLGDVVHGPNCRMSNIKDSEGNGIILHQLNSK